MDLSKLSTGRKIYVVAGLVYFIATFLKWYSYDVAGFISVSANAWDIG
ncbi:MAG: hypothetical protein QOJ74_96, partial [Ilumatobacteraceae bacterium]|nr:hypothetical protein [Ilumatobacteraceae bacterium]